MKNQSHHVLMWLSMGLVVALAGCTAREGSRQSHPTTEPARVQAPDQPTKPEESAVLERPDLESLVAANMALRGDNISEARQLLDTTPADKRSWLWYCLHAALDESVKVLDDHSGPVLSVVFRGGYLASTSADGSVVLWKSGGDAPPTTVSRTKTPVQAAALSPGGKRLAYSTGSTVVLFDVAGNSQLAELSGHASKVGALAFGPDGSILASADAGGHIRLWDMLTLEPFADLSGHSAAIACLAFDPAGTRLASGSDDRSVRLWDTDRLSEMSALVDLDGAVTDLAFNAEGTQLAYATATGAVTALDTVALTPVQKFNAPSAINAIAFSPDGSQLVGSVNALLQFWDVETGNALHQLRGHERAIRDLSWSPISGELATGSDDGTVRLWDSAPVGILQDKHSTVRSMAFNSDGSRLAGAIHDRTICIWDTVTGDELAVLRGHTARCTGVDFSPDDKLLASGSYDWDVMLWDAATGNQLALLRGHENLVRCVSFSPDGKHLASAGHDGTVRIWDVTTHRQARVIQTGADVIITAAYSPDGKMLASGDYTSVRLWDPSTGKLLRELGGHDLWVYSLAFSPTNKQLASVAGDGFVRIWDVDSGKLLAKFGAHDDKVLSVVYSQDGTLLFTGAHATVEAWDVESGRRLAALPGHDQWVCSLAFSPNNTLLVAGAEQGLMRRWDSVPYAQRFREQLALAAAQPEAMQVVNKLWAADPVPDDIVATLENDAELNAVTKRAALNDVLSRSAGRLEAVQRHVDSLFRTLAFTEDVVAALGGEAPFDPNLRDVAIARARARGDRPERLDNVAWLWVRRPEMTTEENALALRCAQQAVAAQPDNPQFLTTLGAAQYRNGMFKEALTSLSNAKELATEDAPYTLAFLCMTQKQLGHTADADAIRAEFEEMITQPRHSGDRRIAQAAEEVRQVLSSTGE